MDFNSSNKTFVEEFIEIYRQNSCLWNVKSKDYSNKNKRDVSYKILLQKLQEKIPTATLDILKKKINNMRTAFRRELKKVIESKPTGTSTDDVYEPTLWYYDLLLFTAQSETGRRGKSNDEENEFEREVDENDMNDDDGEETQEIEEKQESASVLSQDEMSVNISTEKSTAPRDFFNETPPTSRSVSRTSNISAASSRSQSQKRTNKSKETSWDEKKQ